jgi:transcription termination factor Rho
MDDHIFEEFKSTGNSELVLDRSLAEARIFPAINVLASSTRKEELLYTEDEVARLAALRRWLAGAEPKAAMRGLLKLLDQAPTNEVLLQRLRPKREPVRPDRKMSLGTSASA